ncbi:MAG: LysM peptidoglycan-binding domain-containing protein [Deltaproteobacteria bacterium]|nr:LysM peptidoglycan-binding domain-containing protein [Deltaproteobacteria bacterium]
MEKKLIRAGLVVVAVSLAASCIPGTSFSEEIMPPQAQTTPPEEVQPLVEQKPDAAAPEVKETAKETDKKTAAGINERSSAVAEPPRGVEPPQGSQPLQGAEAKSYTVVRYDTLWAIAQRYLKDPFKWPALWKINPHIKNPDLIYPGDIVKISAVDEGAGTLAAAAGKKEAGAEGKETEVKAAPAFEAKKPEQVVALEPEKPIVLEPEAESASSGQAALKQIQKTAGAPRITDASLERKGFVSMNESAASGVIIGAREKKTFIGPGDAVYLSLKDAAGVKVGDRFTFFTKGKLVAHPVTKKQIGYLIDIIGNVVVTGTDGAIEAVVDRAYRETEPGTKLRAYEQPVKEVEITKTETDFDNGYIIASIEGKEFFSKGDIVYIDKGLGDNLKKGNTLKIYKKGATAVNPMTGKKTILPEILLGEMVVIESKGGTSACIITQNQRTINLGDIVSTH